MGTGSVCSEPGVAAIEFPLDDAVNFTIDRPEGVLAPGFLSQWYHSGAGEYIKRTVSYWGGNVWKLYPSLSSDQLEDRIN